MQLDVAPVVAARALLAHSVNDLAILAYLSRTWQLNPVDARAAIAAARTLDRPAR